MKKVVVISLGGSLIVPDRVDYKLIENFRKAVRKNYKKYFFVVVCGGGSIARKYINALNHEHKSKKELSQAGIRATRMNAMLLIEFFGKEANSAIPRDMKEVKAMLKKNKIVFCGALRWVPDSTSDGTAARLASFLKADFINITNVRGLYSRNPLTNKNAKFIHSISWKEFEKKAKKIKYKPGEHFVLDQEASSLIRKHRIRTYIIGRNLSNIEKILKGKNFTGTLIEE